MLNELNKLEKIKILNGIKVKSIFDYLNQIDWLDISNGKQCNFHGDLHGSNIIFKNNKFTLLDWREKFGNDMYTGDIYYELGKLYHGIIVDHEFVSKSEFKINIFKNTASIKPKIDNNLKCADRIFWEFIKNKKFNEKKIIIITGLIFINISPLHSKHYRSFLYLLGKYMLATHERFKHTYTY